MVQNAADGKKDVRSVNAKQGCSNTELRIVGNSNKLVYWTSRIYTGLRAACSTKLHYIEIFIVILRTKLTLLYKYTWRFLKLLKGIKEHCCKFSKFEYYMTNTFQKVLCRCRMTSRSRFLIFAKDLHEVYSSPVWFPKCWVRLRR